MSSTYGESLKLSIFGESHGPAVGMTLDAIPAGFPVDFEQLQQFLNRRAPGQNSWSTPRKESDQPEFLSGIARGFTTGAPICAVIPNTNTRSGDYEDLKNRPRPGHADYTAQIKYGGYQSAAGGGHFSGRLTAPLCIAGGLSIQWLADMGIQIGAHIARIADIDDAPFDPISPDFFKIGQDFPVISPESGIKMRSAIQVARESGDSVGGIISCAVTGIPAGIGEPMFGGVESRIAQIIYGIPAVKALEFGLGREFSSHPGSFCNDAFTAKDGRIQTITNHCGGILGGITDGMPLLFQVTFKPTPSISRPQQTVDLARGCDTTVEIQGRHDPCIVPRAVPVVEAAAAIAIFDMILGNTQYNGRKD